MKINHTKYATSDHTHPCAQIETNMSQLNTSSLQYCRQHRSARPCTTSRQLMIGHARECAQSYSQSLTSSSFPTRRSLAADQRPLEYFERRLRPRRPASNRGCHHYHVLAQYRWQKTPWSPCSCAGAPHVNTDGIRTILGRLKIINKKRTMTG